MGWGGLAIAGASLLGSIFSSNAAQNAAGDQAAAAAIASGTQLQMYQQTRADLLPAMTSGNAALRSLDALIGLTPQASDTPPNMIGGGGGAGSGNGIGGGMGIGGGPGGGPNPNGPGGGADGGGAFTGAGGGMYGGAPDISGPNAGLPQWGNSPFKSLQQFGNPTAQQQADEDLQAAANAQGYWNTPAGQQAAFQEQMQSGRNASIAQQQVLSGTAFGKMVAKKQGGPIGPGNYVVGEQGRPEIVHLTPGSTGYVVPNPKTVAENLPHRFLGGSITGANVGSSREVFNPVSGPVNRFGLPVRTPSAPIPSSPAQQLPNPIAVPYTPPAPIGAVPHSPLNPVQMQPPANSTMPIRTGSGDTIGAQSSPFSALSPSNTIRDAQGNIVRAWDPNAQHPMKLGGGTIPISPASPLQSPSNGIISLGPRAAPPMPPTGGPVNYPGQQPPAYPYYTPPAGPPASDPTQGNNVALPGSGQTPASIMAQSPQYQFVMQQGIQGLDNSAAARGGLLSGGHLADILNYSQGVASQQFQNIYNNLATVASLGESAGAMVGNAGTYAGMGMSNALMAGGNAAAAGEIGSANSYNSTLGNLGFMYAMNPNMFGGSTGGGG